MWVAVLWKKTRMIGTYRAGGVDRNCHKSCHEGVFDVIPWDGDGVAEAPTILSLCDAYTMRELSREEFKAGLSRTGCPAHQLDAIVAMVEAKAGMPPAPAPSPLSTPTKPPRAQYLSPEAVSAPAAASPEDEQDGMIGTTVTVDGLVNAAEHNGKQAVVQSKKANGRYIVKLSSGEAVALKPGNLKPTRTTLEVAAAAGLDDRSIAQADDDDWESFGISVEDGRQLRSEMRQKMRQKMGYDDAPVCL